MQRLALALAVGAVLAVGLPAPAQYLGLGLAIAAIGTGRVAYARRTLPGSARLAGAAAITIGAIGFGLAAIRVTFALVAIGHIEGLLLSS